VWDFRFIRNDIVLISESDHVMGVISACVECVNIRCLPWPLIPQQKRMTHH